MSDLVRFLDLGKDRNELVVVLHGFKRGAAEIGEDPDLIDFSVPGVPPNMDAHKAMRLVSC
jgi:hypothetical protein